LSIHIDDLLMPPVVTLVFLFIFWAFTRSLRGRHLDGVQRKLIGYGCLVVLGGSYICVLGRALGWPVARWNEAAVVWAVLVILFAWWRYKRNRRLTGNQLPKVPARAYISTALPFLGVLVSLVMSAIEWEFVAEGQGHLWQALAWTAALAASIWLARKNRRAAVVMALRVFLVLGVIGAIGHPSVTLVVALGVVAVVYFLIERLWPKRSDPPILDFESLSRNKPN
jgi:Ca2+/Na+ antiporter